MFKRIIRLLRGKRNRDSIQKRSSTPSKIGSKIDFDDITQTISKIKNLTIIVKMLIDNNSYNRDLFPATFQLCRIFYDLVVSIEYNFNKEQSKYSFESLISAYHTLHNNCPVVIEVMMGEASKCEFRNATIIMIHRLIKRMKELELYVLEKIGEISPTSSCVL